jgi:hypothetical protein
MVHSLHDGVERVRLLAIDRNEGSTCAWFSTAAASIALVGK